MTSGIEQAIDKAGGQADLAKALGVTQQVVSEWKTRGYAPTKHVIAIERLTGVARRSLCDPELLRVTAPNPK